VGEPSSASLNPDSPYEAPSAAPEFVSIFAPTSPGRISNTLKPPRGSRTAGPHGCTVF